MARNKTRKQRRAAAARDRLEKAARREGERARLQELVRAYFAAWRSGNLARVDRDVAIRAVGDRRWLKFARSQGFESLQALLDRRQAEAEAEAHAEASRLEASVAYPPPAWPRSAKAPRTASTDSGSAHDLR